MGGDLGALVVHVAPVRRNAHDFFSAGVELVIITSPAAQPLPGQVIRAGLFDLEAVEARIASGGPAGCWPRS